ncbi:hypothetical protein K1T71_008500 [Dendrolimus kikuchii]|uniref:Uncharacterized protein n=1 Tax=Dendrolimus kikuchii TaxID=765133 RepID=A0ACC1CXA7_9NEOP|nr:hypothetical protein K1T71_008500 [Dendrolimus kikuchii]
MDRCQFKVNGIQHTVGSEIRSDVMLVDYLRNHLELRGTKFMCREAGCGACVVSVTTAPGGPVLAVNSCMVSVLSCNDWEITTIEKVGNRLDGYHPVQKTLANYNGTQCGHCTPGFVMTMYSLLKNDPNLTSLKIEESFGGNVCRCTGYRPIMDAFKKFAKDSPDPIPDIEDLQICDKIKKLCDKTKDQRHEDHVCKDTAIEDFNFENDWCYVSNPLKIRLKDNKIWYKVNDVKSVLQLISGKDKGSYMLVAGNTGKGPYPIIDYPDLLIDISDIDELKGYVINQNLIVGAGVTLTNTLKILKTVASKDYFSYLDKLYKHIKLVAHEAVRNIGTLAGNLMIKHEHREFPSDIYLLLETVGAQVTIQGYHGAQTVPMQTFLSTDMTGKILVNVMLPPMSNNHQLVSFKIMPRSQSAAAMVNAGFLYKLDSSKKVLEARIVYGDLSPNFTRASYTEKYLLGKNLFTNETLQAALKILNKELVVVEMLPNPSAEYRKQLALHLFYKGILTLCPSNISNPRFFSGTAKLYETRPVSKAMQVYTTNPALWPLTQPIPKVEALIQCSGEAKYTEDLPSLPCEVFAAFVLSTTGSGVINKIDATVALNYPGVIAFYTAKDIPGINSFTPNNYLLYTSYEEILCSGKVKYYNQPIGVIVGESQEIANKAAEMVQVTYITVEHPVTDVREAMKDPTRNKLYIAAPATLPGPDVTKVIKGEFYRTSQYHFTMETIVCVAFPTEEGLKVQAATQWVTGVQMMISEALKIDANRIDVHVRRIGGGYGFKISRSTQSIIACCLVSYKLNRPCRFIQPVTTNMRAMGKRLPGVAQYEVGVNDAGEIQYCNLNQYLDNGYIIDEDFYFFYVDLVSNCYKKEPWSYSLINTTTDTPSNSWCRAPGTLEAIATAEMIMERISRECSLDPIDVRLTNLDKNKYSDLVEIAETLKSNSDYDKRKAEIDTYNASNRWTKRGLNISFLRWTPISVGIFVVNMSVNLDGTVCITHGGVEMGQGINTKVVQVCAYLLKIPIEKIQIKESSSIFTPNCVISGASVTSEGVCIAVRKCCDKLLLLLEPVKTVIGTQVWEEVIPKAIEMNIDLQVHESFNGLVDFKRYDIFGATAIEVEVDILTGESLMRRVDLIEDVGQSVSPQIDIGQVEGAFIMGTGYWTIEDIVYDPRTGKVLTDRPWNYHVPLARDIPEDFRVYFRKKSYGPENNFGSKAVGEPPICMSIAVLLALIDAVASARLDAGIPKTQWIQIGDAETLCMSSATKLEHLTLY